MVPQNCHPDRSVAKWRDLRFLFRFSRRLLPHELRRCDGYQPVAAEPLSASFPIHSEAVAFEAFRAP